MSTKVWVSTMVIAFGGMVGCSSQRSHVSESSAAKDAADAASDAATSDAASACELEGDHCGSGCSALQGQELNVAAGCLEPTSTLACVAGVVGVPSAQLCVARVDNGKLYLTNGDETALVAEFPDTWRRCTDQEQGSTTAAPLCDQ